MSWTFTIGNLSFGIFDLVLLGIVLISGISGFVTGFSNFAFKILGYVLTFPLSLLFVSSLSSFLSTKINIAPFWISLISYVILCLVIFSLFKLIGVLLSTALSGLSLGWFDSFLGLIVSGTIAFFLTFIILELASLQTFFSLLPLKENSFFYMNVYLPLFPSIEKAFKGRSLVFDKLYKSQPSVAGDLEGNLKNNLLPQSLLFSGPRGSSRLTGALDLACHLTSTQRDILRTQNIIFFPYRDLYHTLRCALNLFATERTEKSRLFLIETLRLVNMQYNSALSGSYTTGVGKLFETAGKVDEFISSIEDKKDITDKDIKELESLKLHNNIKYLYAGKSSPTSVSIDQMRAIKNWSASGSEEKVVIIENIESSTEGAKNSILKMLEEPVEHLNIILISSESQKIMETILSRVRKFNFPQLSKETVDRIIKDKFNTYESYSSFNCFFFTRGNDSASVKKCEDEISSFVSLITEKKAISAEREDEMVNMLDSMNAYTYFMERVVEKIEKMTREGKLEAFRAKKILSVIAYWRECVGIYNLSGRSSIDYILRECSCV